MFPLENQQEQGSIVNPVFIKIDPTLLKVFYIAQAYLFFVLIVVIIYLILKKIMSCHVQDSDRNGAVTINPREYEETLLDSEIQL